MPQSDKDLITQLASQANIVIPGQVGAIREQAFIFKENIKNVVIEEGVKYIGEIGRAHV